MANLFDYLVSQAQARDIPPDLAVRMANTESGMNPNAVSPVGAQGIMQLMPATAKRFGVTDPLDPRQNIRGGLDYLAALRQRYGDDRLAAMAYHAGEGNMDKYLAGQPSGVGPKTLAYGARVGGPSRSQLPRPAAGGSGADIFEAGHGSGGTGADIFAANSQTGSGADIFAATARPAASAPPAAGTLAGNPVEGPGLQDHPVVIGMGQGIHSTLQGAGQLAGDTLRGIDRGAADPRAADAVLGSALGPGGRVLSRVLGAGYEGLKGLTGITASKAADALGLPTAADIEESRRLDRPLMATTGGRVGSVAGNVLATAPLAMLPGGLGLRGAALTGAGLGVAQPVGEQDSRLANAGTGAAFGAGGAALGRVLAAGYQGGKALFEPFTRSGPQAIADRTLARFAADSGRADAAIARNLARTPAGVAPTLAEASLDPGLAKFQLALASVDPQVGGQLAARQLENNAARAQALKGIAGTEAGMDAAIAARKGATEALYKQAADKVVAGDSALDTLLRRPSMQKAVARAQQLAAETGEPVHVPGTPAQQVTTGLLDVSGNPIVRQVAQQPETWTGRGLHFLKMGMDDLTNHPLENGLTGNELRAMRDTRGQYLKWLEDNIDEYNQARVRYAGLSRPINQMQVGQEILKKGASAAEDALGNPTLRPEAYNRAIRDSRQLVKQALGRENAKLSDVLSRQQLATVLGLGKDLSRKQAADKLAGTINSTTMQNLAGANLMRQLAGPLGIPASWTESALLRTLAKPATLAYSLTEPNITGHLARYALDPRLARLSLQRMAARPSGMDPVAAAIAQRITPALSLGAGLAAINGP